MNHFYPRGDVKGWYYTGFNSAFMVPQIEYFSADEIAYLLADQQDPDFSESESVAGWYYRLTAPGYLDCTEWSGAFPNAFRALRDCLRSYEIDLAGNSLA